MSDMVKHPNHYQVNGVEVKDMIREMIGNTGYVFYCLGNVIKYVSHYDKKGTPKQDLQKAQQYCLFVREVLDEHYLHAIDTLYVTWPGEDSKDWRTVFFGLFNNMETERAIEAALLMLREQITLQP